ncbi:MAG: hypothetical protein ACK4FB_03030 [Brevundimonas sp.]
MPLQSLLVVGAVIAAFAAFMVTVGGVAVWSALSPRDPGAGE